MMRVLTLNKRFFREKIQKFYAQSGRRFKWRQEVDPYRVLLTEILLKKTTAKKVETVYDRFFTKYGELTDLLAAKLRDLSREIMPLGLQKQRAKILMELAQVIHIRHGGKVPLTYDDLVSLSGVGRYTANAVLCFAYGEPRSIVDVNVARVLQRFFGLPSTTDVNRDEPLWDLAEQLLPKSHFKEHNLGVIDFAAKVCRAVRPKCVECSLVPHCAYFATGLRASNKNS